MTTLASIRERLKEQDTKSDGGNRAPADSSIYPFWNMQTGESTTFRPLPDGADNDFFWIERAMFKLPFAGVVGQPDSKQLTVQVPCMEMYGEQCKILNEVRAWFKDPSLEDLGRKFWKKRSYVFQGFITVDPLKEENPPENPIRKLVIGPQIFKIIKASLMDPDMDDLPTDYTHGLDFKIVKSDSGSGYADYSTSNWARKSRPLSDSEMAAINKFGLHDLSEALPKKPNEIEQKVLFEMFEASVNGEAYDIERWGAYYKPYGVNVPGDVTKRREDNESRAPIPRPSSSKNESFNESQKSQSHTDDDDDDDNDEDNGDVTPPWSGKQADSTHEPDEEATSDSSKSATDILAMIRARQKA